MEQEKGERGKEKEETETETTRQHKSDGGRRSGAFPCKTRRQRPLRLSRPIELQTTFATYRKAHERVMGKSKGQTGVNGGGW